MASQTALMLVGGYNHRPDSQAGVSHTRAHRARGIREASGDVALERRVGRSALLHPSMHSEDPSCAAVRAIQRVHPKYTAKTSSCDRDK
jgi:hypothetical protein